MAKNDFGRFYGSRAWGKVSITSTSFLLDLKKDLANLIGSDPLQGPILLGAKSKSSPAKAGTREPKTTEPRLVTICS